MVFPPATGELMNDNTKGSHHKMLYMLLVSPPPFPMTQLTCAWLGLSVGVSVCLCSLEVVIFTFVLQENANFISTKFSACNAVIYLEFLIKCFTFLKSVFCYFLLYAQWVCQGFNFNTSESHVFLFSVSFLCSWLVVIHWIFPCLYFDGHLLCLRLTFVFPLWLSTSGTCRGGG